MQSLTKVLGQLLETATCNITTTATINLIYPCCYSVMMLMCLFLLQERNNKNVAGRNCSKE
jgi:hypothetical protein